MSNEVKTSAPAQRQTASGSGGTGGEASASSPVREQLRGHDYATQSAMLAPGAGAAPVQMKSVYRGMTASGEAPALGETARTLGVRPGGDIKVDEKGNVKPTGVKKKEGMSTSPDTPLNLPGHRRPKEWGGTGKDPVWETSDGSLTNDTIQWVQDSGTHGTVEPTKEMPYGTYKSALEATQGSWVKKDAPKPEAPKTDSPSEEKKDK